MITHLYTNILFQENNCSKAKMWAHLATTKFIYVGNQNWNRVHFHVAVITRKCMQKTSHVFGKTLHVIFNSSLSWASSKLTGRLEKHDVKPYASEKKTLYYTTNICRVRCSWFGKPHADHVAARTRIMQWDGYISLVYIYIYIYRYIYIFK